MMEASQPAPVGWSATRGGGALHYEAKESLLPLPCAWGRVARHAVLYRSRLRLPAGAAHWDTGGPGVAQAAPAQGGAGGAVRQANGYFLRLKLLKFKF